MSEQYTQADESPVSPEEDSGYEQQDPAARAWRWAEDIRTRPLHDEQATALAQVYASLALVEQQSRIAAALEAIAAKPVEATESSPLPQTPDRPERPAQKRTERSRAQSKPSTPEQEQKA